MRDSHSAPDEGSRSPPPSVGRAALVVGGFTLASRVVALVRDLVISHLFGATRLTDVFFTAFTIPNVMRRLVAEGGVTVAFIPVYTDVRQNEGDEAARRFLAATAGLCLVGVLILTLLGIAGAPALVYAFASGFAKDPAVFALAVELTRWLFPYVYFISLVGLAMGALNAHGHFAAPAAAPVFLNLAMVGSALLLRDAFAQPIFTLVVGALAGGVLQLLLQLPALQRAGILVVPRLDLASPRVRELLRLLVPALFGLGVYQVNILLLRQLGSYLPEAHLTYYYNADRLAQFAFGVFGIAIATAALPEMSRHAQRGDTAALVATWRHSLRLTTFVVLPAASGLFAVSLPIVAVLYRHGAFTWDDVRQTAAATAAFAPWLIATAAVRSTVQAFYAVKDTKTPVKVGVLSVALTFGFGVALLEHEVVGLCAALSLASFVHLVVLTGLLGARVGPLGLRDVLRGVLLQAALTAVAVTPAYALSRLGRWESGPTVENGLVLAGAIGVAIAIYAAGALLLDLEEARAVRRRIVERLRRRRRRGDA